MAFNAWSAAYALTHVIEGLFQADDYDIAILDRGLFDALVWFELMARNGDISTNDRDHVQAFLLIEKWRSAIDAVFLFKADPATSMEREHADKLISEPGRAMNPDFLSSLNGAYDEVRDKYSSEFPVFRVVDTSGNQGTTARGTAAEVVREMLAVMDGPS